MSSGTSSNSQNHPTDSSFPQAPIRKKRQTSLLQKSGIQAGIDKPVASDEILRRHSFQQTSGVPQHSPQHLKDQSDIPATAAGVVPPPPAAFMMPSGDGQMTNKNIPIVIPPVSHSPPKPLRKDQVYLIEFTCESKGLGITLSMGHHNQEGWKSTLHGNGMVYHRKDNRDFFQIEEIKTTQDFGLRRGDELLAINGCMLDKYSLDYAAIVLEEAAYSGHVQLAITRAKKPPSRMTEYVDRRDVDHKMDLMDPFTSAPPPDMSVGSIDPVEGNVTLSYSEPFDIHLMKEENGKSLGIGIVGGVDAPRGPIGFFIKTVYPNGLVAEDGCLKTGDEILSLNGVPLQGMKREDAVNMFKLLPAGPVRLTVRSLIPFSTNPADASSTSLFTESPAKWKTFDGGYDSGNVNQGGKNNSELFNEIMFEYGKNSEEPRTVIFDTFHAKPGADPFADTMADPWFPVTGETDAMSSKSGLEHDNRISFTGVMPSELVDKPVSTNALQSPQSKTKESYYNNNNNNKFPDFGTQFEDSTPALPPVRAITPTVENFNDNGMTDFVVTHRVIQLHDNSTNDSDINRNFNAGDTFWDDKNYDGGTSSLSPGDIFKNYLQQKNSSELEEKSVEFIDPPDEFSSSMFIADDNSDGETDVNFDLQNGNDTDHNSAVAAVWHGMQNKDAPLSRFKAGTFENDPFELSNEFPDCLPTGPQTSDDVWKESSLTGLDPFPNISQDSNTFVKPTNVNYVPQEVVQHSSNISADIFKDSFQPDFLQNSSSTSELEAKSSMDYIPPQFGFLNTTHDSENGRRDPILNDIKPSTETHMPFDLILKDTSLSNEISYTSKFSEQNPSGFIPPQKVNLTTSDTDRDRSGVIQRLDWFHPCDDNVDSKRNSVEQQQSVQNSMPGPIKNENMVFDLVKPDFSQLELGTDTEADAWLEACISPAKMESSKSRNEMHESEPKHLTNTSDRIDLFSEEISRLTDSPSSFPLPPSPLPPSSPLPPPSPSPPLPLLPQNFAAEDISDISESEHPPPPLPASPPPPLPASPPPLLPSHPPPMLPVNNIFASDPFTDAHATLYPENSLSSVKHEEDIQLKLNSYTTPMSSLGTESFLDSDQLHTSKSKSGNLEMTTGTMNKKVEDILNDNVDKIPIGGEEYEYDQIFSPTIDANEIQMEKPLVTRRSVSSLSDNKTSYEEEDVSARSETEPFMVKVIKNICGLGMTVFVTGKGAVINNIQKMGPLGRTKTVRVNDYLLAVNGINLQHKTAEQIQEILETLPIGLVRLTISAQPPVAAADDDHVSGGQMSKRDDGMAPLSSLNLTRSQSAFSSHNTTQDMSGSTSFPIEASNTFAVSRRSISRDEIVGNVLKDYYNVEEKPADDTSSSKPKKPLIAQALLPKSKRSGSLTAANSALSTLDIKRQTNVPSSPLQSEYGEVSSSDRTIPDYGIINAAPGGQTRNLSLSADPLSVTSSWKAKPFPVEEKERMPKSYVQYSKQNDLAHGDVSEKDDDDSASTVSETSSVHSAGIPSNTNESSFLARSRSLAEVETEYTRKVASSKAFFESMQADNKRTQDLPSTNNSRILGVNSKQNETVETAMLSDELNAGDKEEQAETFAPEKETLALSDSINIAESKAFFRSMENSSKQSTNPLHSKTLPVSGQQNSVSNEASIRKHPKLSTEFSSNSEKTSGTTEVSPSMKGSELMSSIKGVSTEPENKTTDTMLTEKADNRAVSDSESINIAESKAFFKSMEQQKKNVAKSDSTNVRNFPVISQEQKTGMDLRNLVKPKDELSKLDIPVPHPSNIEANTEKSQVELVKVTNTKAYYESLTPSTPLKVEKQKPVMQKVERPSDVIQESVVATTETKSLPSDTHQIQPTQPEIDKPRAVVQPVFRKLSAPKVNQQPGSGRLPTLPTQKYLPVPAGAAPRPSAPPPSLWPTQKLSQSTNRNSLPLISSSNSAFQEPTGNQEDLPSKARNSVEQQKLVESLVTKYSTSSPTSKTDLASEQKYETPLLVKRENATQVRFQHRYAGVNSPPTPTDTEKIKSVPSPPTSSAAASAGTPPSSSAMPSFGTSTKSQQWKQFMADYSSPS